MDLQSKGSVAATELSFSDESEVGGELCDDKGTMPWSFHFYLLLGLYIGYT